ncbi:hypothetical protein HDEF_1923 [Candidatus Hamiltonella defensa 5AT (Acyrthosiphon pisum)]|uniref:Uncharacterized protein n=1 Tax=Hamiltonella defensa subsp. Acyrthosiphon pisum (strain 5AT) TaxID=572265 RepID=C4K7G9_HAMD5|nr:hypothetical protein HDEF_1923 [Candidatus Hamiltonella defensa 5AT (Acyrthosiphon pisum)]
MRVLAKKISVSMSYFILNYFQTLFMTTLQESVYYPHPLFKEVD